MFRSYLRTAFRSIGREKGYTFLNILGLSIGLAGCVLLFSHVRADFLWDGFHPNGDRMYRLNQVQSIGGVEPQHVAYSAPPIAPVIAEEVPEIAEATRYMNTSDLLVTRGNGEKFYVRRAAYVDPNFLTLFGYTLGAGEREHALDDPHGLVINEELAKRYFGSENPVGQVLRVYGTRDVTVTGVLDEFPAGSHLNFEMLLPFDASYEDLGFMETARDSWGYNTLATYLLLEPTTTAVEVNAKLPEFFGMHRDVSRVEYYLQPLADLHLRSNFVKYEINYGQQSIKGVYTLMTIGIFLLLLAVINYTNLASARAVRRAREVGMRKVVGARVSQLVAQFMIESTLVTLLSTLVALGIVLLSKGWFEEIAGRSISFDPLSGGFETWLVAGLFFLVSMLTGLYPALVLASYRPAVVLKGRVDSQVRGSWLRRGLVILQFASSIVLIIATTLVYRQIEYSRKTDLGFDRKHVVYIPLREDAIREKALAIRDRVAQIPGVEAASISTRPPVFGGGQTSVTPEGMDEPYMVSYYFADAYQRDVLQFKMLEGRYFAPDRPLDKVSADTTTGALVLNQTAVQKLGWTDPLGKTIEVWGGRKLPVIGVVEDFHYQSFRQEIEPMMFVCDEDARYLSFRYEGQDPAPVLDRVEAIWAQMTGDAPFSSTFLDERFDQLYSSDSRFGVVLRLFSFLTIFIASLGLLGLAAHATHRRIREIGVRKVLGASVGQILVLMGREFAFLVAVSSLIAWPTAWFLMRGWVEQFTYRPAYGWWLYPVAGGGALLIALLTVSFLAWRAANSNPANVLRQE
ncbi:ABC transporter permease [bacterium]|nr:ABC transporter permease [bacterium]